MLTALLGLTGVGGVAGLVLHLFGWSGTLAKLTSFGRGAKATARKVPSWVWIALAVAAVLLGGYLWINHKIHQAYANGSKAGHAAQFAYDEGIAAKARAQARDFKQKLDTANVKIHNQEQTSHDQTVAANHTLADALRVRIAQRQRVQAGDRSSANLPGAAATGVPAGGSQAPTDAGLGQGAARPLVCVDAYQLVDYAEQADNDHDALVKTEDAQKRYAEHWPAPPR